MGRSRSLKMAPFDRPYATSYWSAIVNIALFCAVFELFDVEQYRDLEIWLWDHSRLFKLVPLESLGAFSYSPSIVAISCIVCEILLVENREIFIPNLYLAPPQGWPRRNFRKMFDAGKTRMIALPYGEKLWQYVKPFSSDTGAFRTDRQTDRQTDGQICYINIARQYADARWKLRWLRW